MYTGAVRGPEMKRAALLSLFLNLQGTEEVGGAVRGPESIEPL